MDAALEPARSALLTLSDGVIGARAGSGDADGTGVVAAGIYEGDGAETALAQLPRWNDVTLEGAIVRRRVLDLQEGTLRSEIESPRGDARSLAFASLARPGTAVLVVEGPALVADRPRASRATRLRPWPRRRPLAGAR